MRRFWKFTLRSRFTITVDSVNSIIVTIGGRDSEESRTVRYTKVTDDIQARLIGRPDAQIVMAPSDAERYLMWGTMVSPWISMGPG